MLGLISLGRNAIVIIASSLVAFLLEEQGQGQGPFKLVGHVQGGFPPFGLPPFLLPVKERGNSTVGEASSYHDFWESWTLIRTGPFVIALISILQNVAIAKAFGSGQKVDATQEMIALGASNVLGGFVSAIPSCAAFSRSAVNEASGVRSPLGGLFTGALVLLSLSLLTPSFYYIPKASLSAVIISAVFFMIDYGRIRPMWRISKMDTASCIVTMISSLLLGMEYGIAVGVLISVGALLERTLRPDLSPTLLKDEGSGTQYLALSPPTSLPFPSIPNVSSYIYKLSESCGVIVLDFSNWRSVDYTAASTLCTLVKGLERGGKRLIFLNCGAAWEEALRAAGLPHPPSTNGGTEFEQYLKVLPKGKDEIGSPTYTNNIELEEGA